MEDRVYSVTELNRIVKIQLESSYELNNFFLVGEISNITYYKSGHLYFTMKDKNSSIKCAAFTYKFKKIPEDLKEGEQVKIFGNINVYEAGGSFQVSVGHLERQNTAGLLYAQFEKLKTKLAEKGYFDDERKRTLPVLPRNIGVVTAETGAAIRDIINTAKKRFENINIYLYPSKVQGEGADKEIIKGINVLNSLEFIDVIIIGRGGGSIEDLWAFNSEELANVVFNSQKPIISAVGHEIDFVITDFVADKRASTPTQAIEILVPEKQKLQELLTIKEKRLKIMLQNTLRMKKEALLKRENEYIIRNFTSIINGKKEMVENKKEELHNAILKLVSDKKNTLGGKVEKLEALSPLAVLKRGYSITKIADGEKERILRSISDAADGAVIKTKLIDGEVVSVIKKQ